MWTGGQPIPPSCRRLAMNNNILDFPIREEVAMNETQPLQPLTGQKKADADLAAFCSTLTDLLNNPLECLARLRMAHPETGASLGFNCLLRQAMNDMTRRQREVHNYVHPNKPTLDPRRPA